VLAVRKGAWRVAPRGDVRIEAGDELFVAGRSDALDRFAETVA
jgi:Trk K+ transport system NAD-binding subunit